MARKQAIGEIRYWWVTTIANIAAPTAAEITAGVDLTPFGIRDGLSTPRGANVVDTSDVSNKDNTQDVGTRDNGPITISAHRDSVTGSDTFWNTLVEDTVGYVVVRRFGGSTLAAIAAQKVEVYPAIVATVAPVDIAENQSQRVLATIAITRAPNLRATVA
jgi:hypothetical protein